MSQPISGQAQTCCINPGRTFRPGTPCSRDVFCLCAQLDAKGFARLRTIRTLERFAKDSIVFEQGREIDRVFIVADGMLKLYYLLPDGRRQIVGFLGPGDVLGALHRGHMAHSTAQAITEVHACALKRDDFLDLISGNADLTLEFLFTATDEIEAEHDHLVLLGRRHGHERLAAFLLIMNQRWPRHARRDETVTLPMSRSDIADYLGLTIESVSRIFTRFRKLGLLDTSTANSVVLKNIPALLAKAGLEDVPVRGVGFGL